MNTQKELKILQRIKDDYGIVTGYIVADNNKEFYMRHTDVVHIMMQNTQYKVVNARLTKSLTVVGYQDTIPTVIRKPSKTENSGKPHIVLIEKIETRTTNGILSKGWYAIDGVSYLVKGNTEGHYEPYSEVLASRLLRGLGFDNVVMYELGEVSDYGVKVFGINHVSLCRTYLRDGVNEIPFAEYVEARVGRDMHASAFLEWIVRNDAVLPLEYVLKMLVADAFIGNKDRHLNNWGILSSKKGIEYAPIMDFGASLLAWESDREIERVLKAGESAYGPDASRPFTELHQKQIKVVKRIAAKTGIKINIPRDYKDRVDKVLSSSADVFDNLPKKRAEAIKKYLYLRLKYLEMFV